MGLIKKRIKKAEFFARLLSAIPFVRMIALTGSLAQGEARPESDIDFFIVTKRGRIWTTRFLTILLVKLLGQRPSKNKTAGRICLNCYQTDQSLEISPYDLYHAETFSSLVPLFDLKIYPEFKKANQWLEEKFKLKLQPSLPNLNLVNNSFFGFFRKIGEFILKGQLGDFLEEKLAHFQKKIILNNIKKGKIQKGRFRISDLEVHYHLLK